jgi:hypothetical protein
MECSKSSFMTWSVHPWEWIDAFREWCVRICSWQWLPRVALWQKPNSWSHLASIYTQLHLAVKRSLSRVSPLPVRLAWLRRAARLDWWYQHMFLRSLRRKFHGILPRDAMYTEPAAWHQWRQQRGHVNS